ncbi:MAG: selenocysteine-specific translation elongation factor [Deltaproteobacteria bacterium]|nr:selenocysteine-specific translation elongation factor [Deltaproteobacteria bacterium]
MIIGTAGHIDHGKTSLIRVLTGIDTDRLKEEKKRGMSIDIGFAYLDLPGNLRAGIVDVPGHENFIRNMLAGIQGIDIVLFVVAADDGVMPQTREHLDIIDLLGITKGIAVITKTDLVNNQRTKEVINDVRKLLRGRSIESAPIIPFSAKSGEGKEEINKHLERESQRLESLKEKAFFRMPVDRSFTIKGIGTVVTGTVISGAAAEGGKVCLFPVGKALRIRHIESHGKDRKTLKAGMRGAINLPGIDKSEIKRGDVLTSPELGKTTQWFDATFTGAPFNNREITSGERVHLHMGTADIIANVYPLGKKKLTPNEKGRITLKLSRPLLVMRGDRFIIRDYSAQKTLGGGQVLNPFRPHLKKRELTGYFDLLESNNPVKIAPFLLNKRGGSMAAGELAEILNLPEKLLIPLLEKNSLFRLSGENLILEKSLEDLEKSIINVLEKFHDDEPSQQGMEAETLLQKVSAIPMRTLFKEVTENLLKKGTIEKTGDRVSLKGRGRKLSPFELENRKKVLATVEDKGYQTASESYITGHDKNLKACLAAMAKEGLVLQISKDNFLAKEPFETAKEKLLTHFNTKETISIIEYKNILNTGRKGAILILEYFDKTHLTVRKGDERVLFKK